MRVGDDMVLRKGEQLIICSKSDMDEWQIQQTRKTAIYVDDEVWCLVEKRRTATKEVRYMLEPWPDHLHQIPGRRITYNEDYVKTRNEAQRKRRIEAGIGPVLYFFRAFIGFLPSGLKSRLESEFGVPARNATFLSIIVELLLFFLLGALLQIFVYGSMRHPALVIYVPTFIALVVPVFSDVVMRYHSYLRDDASPWGSFEWLVRWVWDANKLLLARIRKGATAKSTSR
jgi:hypothetical protein